MKKTLLFCCMVFASLWASARVTEVNDFWDTETQQGPIVIEVYDSWCAPCKEYGPIVERMSGRYEGKVDFYKINIDNPEAEEFVSNFEITCVPTTLFFWQPIYNDSYIFDKQEGMMRPGELDRYIRDLISKQAYK